MTVIEAVLWMLAALAVVAVITRAVLRRDGERRSRYDALTPNGQWYARRLLLVAFLLPVISFAMWWAASSGEPV